jgi:hypothetical protein
VVAKRTHATAKVCCLNPRMQPTSRLSARQSVEPRGREHRRNQHDWRPKVTIAAARSIPCILALLGTLGPARGLHAQMGAGTWVRKPTASTPGTMTMTVEACCKGGRRLIYHIDINGRGTILSVESPFDGNDAPVLMDGKPTGETMAITRVDDHHLSNVVKMNGKPFGTSKATLSADGKLLTVLNDFSSSAGAQPVGKFTEIWLRK